jgi:hypothetical protein
LGTFALAARGGQVCYLNDLMRRSDTFKEGKPEISCANSKVPTSAINTKTLVDAIASTSNCLTENFKASIVLNCLDDC